MEFLLIFFYYLILSRHEWKPRGAPFIGSKRRGEGCAVSRCVDFLCEFEGWGNQVKPYLHLMVAP